MILGIDYGDKWCGLAVSEGSLASPLKSVALENIFDEIAKLQPEKVVVGVSEGRMAQRTLKFVERLKEKFPVETVDETLTSLEAEKIRSKDKLKQHSIAAALILQRYLDNI